MCTIHLVKADSSGIIRVYEDTPKKLAKRPEHQKILDKDVKKSFVENLRNKETMYLSGTSYKASPVESHHLSPQMGSIITKVHSQKWCERRIECGIRHVHGRRGLDDHYKDRALRAAGSGKTRAISSI